MKKGINFEMIKGESSFQDMVISNMDFNEGIHEMHIQLEKINRNTGSLIIGLLNEKYYKNKSPVL